MTGLMIKGLAIGLLTIGLTGHAAAALRLLIEFDQQGHRVHRIYQIPGNRVGQKESGRNRVGQASSARTIRRSAENRAEARKLIAARQQSARRSADQAAGDNGAAESRIGRLRIRWYDAAGSLISEDSVPDPRCVHEPANFAGRSTALVLAEGAYLLDAPDGSVSADLAFPAWQLADELVPALAQSLWFAH